MNAALYFELVDAVTRIDGPAQLKAVADRIASTPMHPLERRVLERALRARTEALDIHEQLLPGAILDDRSSGARPLTARG
jgi:hypothetical protein